MNVEFYINILVNKIIGIKVKVFIVNNKYCR